MATMEIPGVFIHAGLCKADMSQLEKDNILTAQAYQSSGSDSESQVVLPLGLGVLIMLLLLAMISRFATWMQFEWWLIK